MKSTNMLKKLLPMLIIATLVIVISTASLAIAMPGTMVNPTLNDDIPNVVFGDGLDDDVELEGTQELVVEIPELTIPMEAPMPAAIAGTYTWPSLKSGSSGANVYALQYLLNYWAMDLPSR